ncbi:MAG: putative nucleotidyltransferase [Chloroflexi bacterium]|nr:putative nucleotidyltransferase [Chloroflexota bacterium]
MDNAAAPRTMDALRARRDEILRIAAEYGASKVRIFGSVARGEADERSDVDVLVDMAKEPTGFAYFGRLDQLRTALEELLGCHVDVADSSALQRTQGFVMRASLRMRERVFRDAAPL